MAGRAPASVERQPKKSPAEKKSDPASAPGPEPIVSPPATFLAGAPRRLACA